MSKVSEYSVLLIEETIPSVPKLAVNIILSLSLVTIFIGIFFFTYAKNLEKKIIIKNIYYLVDNIGDSLVPLLPGEINEQIYQNLYNFKLPDLSNADINVAEENQKLLVKSCKVIGTLFVVCIAISYFICKKYNLDFTELLITNFFLLLAIIFAEYIFLNTIIFNWIVVDPNKMKTVVINKLQD